MANYRDIKGFQIQSTDTDPDVYAGVWSSGANTNTARRFTPGAGTSGPTHNNVLIFGGSPSVVDTESYDGSSWTELNNLSANKSVGLGTATAALGVGSGVAVEQWNGTSWTEINDINSTRNFSGTQGSTTAALIEGGEAPGGSSALTESYNGSTWTEVNDLNTSRFDLSGSGSQTQALVYAGNADPPRVTSTESWDGTSWTEINDISTARASANNAGAGTGTTSAVLATGQTPGSVETQLTEEFGYPSGPSFLVEGQMWFNTTTSVLKAYGTAAGVPAATWSSGGSLNTARAYIGSATRGTQNASLGFGGDPNGSAITESYNGTSWTEVNDLNNARAGASGAGTQTSALASCGFPSTGKDKSESWNGTSWTEVSEPNLGRDSAGGTGASNTSAMIFGGYNPPQIYENETELWNGTSWTEVNNLNTARRTFGTAAGIVTSAIAAGGSDQPSGLDNVETWDGTSWTEVAEMNAAVSQSGLGSDGTNTNVLRFGGEVSGSPNVSATTEIWNGSSWTELNDMSTARYTPGGAGSTAKAIAFGGYTTTDVANTEEWTAPATVSTVKTS